MGLDRAGNGSRGLHLLRPPGGPGLTLNPLLIIRDCLARALMTLPWASISDEWNPQPLHKMQEIIRKPSCLSGELRYVADTLDLGEWEYGQIRGKDLKVRCLQATSSTGSRTSSSSLS